MSVATQPPKLDTKSVAASGGQLVTAADLASGFMVDANADEEATLYRLLLRTASGTAYVGGSGHGGGCGDYTELISVSTDEYAYPDLVRRTDLQLFYAYAATSKDVHIRICKVVA